MQIIGLTGGIGTGKSTTCKLLKEIDPKIIIIDADVLSHEATKPETGELIRSRLAEIIFAPNKKGRTLKKIVERCIHPWIIWKMCLAIVWYWLKGETRIILDIPLLFEAKLQWLCTWTLLIDTTNSEIQLKRILKRNPQMTEEEAKNRISAQFPMEKKRKLADLVINNDGDLVKLKETLKLEFKKPNEFQQRLKYLYMPMLLIAAATVIVMVILFK